MVAPAVSTAQLVAWLDHDPPTLLDVRWSLSGPPGLDLYADGHIAGAVFVDLDRELAAPPGPGRHPLPDPRSFEAAMRRAGVSRSRRVVAYDGGEGIAAARAWWLLRHFGHPDVHVLDGGFALWRQEGRPVTGEVPQPEPGDFTAGPGELPVVDAAGAAAVAREGLLLDVRAPERFRGEREPVDRVAGHIPGAVNLPATTLLDGHGRLLPPSELRRVFESAGMEPATRVAAYCGSGVTAAQAVMAMAAAGIDAALYGGSWSDWITDPSRPVATGTVK